MFRSRMNSVSTLALAAVGLFAGSMSATAADLGGDCCADLEERIAELEATTARKGNRKVSLTINGQVSTAVLFWDDGQESNAYVVDNDSAQSRFRLLGKAKIAEGWHAGYLIEIGLDSASSDEVDQTNDDRDGNTSNSIELRHSSWFIESDRLGKLTVGQTSPSTDDLYKYGNVGTPFSDAELHYNGSFFLRGNNGALTGLRWDDIATNLDTSRGNYVRYDSPTLHGFTASAAWGEDDQWDVALRYSGEFNGVKVKAAVGYVDDNEGSDSARNESNDLIVSGGLHHVATGLFVYGAYGRRDFDQQPAAFDDTAEYYYVQGGLIRKFFPLGNTILHVDYGYYDNFGSGTSFTDAAGASVTIVESEVERWGLGVTQKIDAAALELFAVFNYYQADLETTGTAAGANVDDWYGVVTGARIQF